MRVKTANGLREFDLGSLIVWYPNQVELEQFKTHLKVNSRGGQIENGKIS